MNLNALMPLMKRRQDGGLGFECFRADPALTGLSWPDDALRDFLYEHGDHGPFVDDYGHLDLSTITWTLDDRGLPHHADRQERSRTDRALRTAPGALGHGATPTSRPALE